MKYALDIKKITGNGMLYTLSMTQTIPHVISHAGITQSMKDGRLKQHYKLTFKL